MGVVYILLSRTDVRLRLADNEASPKETIGRMHDGKITMARPETASRFALGLALRAR